jgi:hypothetical protein
MDEWTTIAKAVRRARRLLQDYIEPGDDRNAEITIAQLVGILQHRDVSDAMRRLQLALEGPGSRSGLARAPAGSRRPAVKNG